MGEREGGEERRLTSEELVGIVDSLHILHSSESRVSSDLGSTVHPSGGSLEAERQKMSRRNEARQNPTFEALRPEVGWKTHNSF